MNVFSFFGGEEQTDRYLTPIQKRDIEIIDFMHEFYRNNKELYKRNAQEYQTKLSIAEEHFKRNLKHGYK